MAEGKQLSLRQELSQPWLMEQVARALPKHITADRFLRVVTTAMTRTPKLELCDKASFMAAMLTLSQYGLEPNGRQAHLVPFENRKRGIVECQLFIDYKGFAELAFRSGQIKSIHADVVCENDEFDFDLGQVTKHKIDLRKPRGSCYAAYARIEFVNGGVKCEVMGASEIEAIRARSKARDAGPWVTDWAEMAKKTVFRRASKWIPLSPEIMDAFDREDTVDGEVLSSRVEPARPASLEFLTEDLERRAQQASQTTEAPESLEDDREPEQESEPQRQPETPPPAAAKPTEAPKPAAKSKPAPEQPAEPETIPLPDKRQGLDRIWVEMQFEACTSMRSISAKEAQLTNGATAADIAMIGDIAEGRRQQLRELATR
jgi:recombination protein RecT